MALSFIKKWFNKSSVYENLKRWHDSPLRHGVVSRERRNSRRAGAARLGLELLETRDVPDAVPAVILTVDPTPFIGSQNEPVSITFTNATADGSTQPGYGPWVYAIIPASGTPANSPGDGISYVANSASFLGTPLSENLFTVPVSGSVTGPSYARNAAGVPITLTGLTQNDQVVFFQLPYISFAPDQPNATITFNTNVSTFADLGVPLTITAGGGFGLGEDPLDNPGTDTPLIAPVVSSAVSPQLIRVTKTYIGPEQETATGPNYVRQYRIDARVAPGQTITAFQINDFLSDGMQFVPGTITGSATGGTFTGPTGTTATAATPGGTIVGNFDQVMGDASATSVDATMMFSFFVPRNYAPATGGEIVPLANGDFEDLTNIAGGAGNWDPLDPLDATITSTDPFWSSPSARDTDIITAKSIATQKGVTVVGGGSVQQGAVLEYTINFQVSDYFALDQLNIPDLLPDGVRFQNTFTPKLSVTQHSGLNHSGDFAPANYAVQAGFNADGTQTLRFDVSNELGGTGRLIGGWIPTGGTGGPQPSQPNGNSTPATFGATTGQIVFRAVIQPAYDVRVSPNGNSDIKQGDDLLNVVPRTNGSGNLTQAPGGRVLNFDDLTPTAFRQADNTSASVRLATGSITKSIYAINGQIYNSAVPPNLQAGDSVTFRITYVLPTSTVENFVLTDYLPLPVFDATTVTTFAPGGPSAAIPAAGTAKFGPGIAGLLPPGLTLPGGTVNYSTVFAAPANNPTVAGPNDGTNRVILTFPQNLEDLAQRTSLVDVLFTVTIQDEPFADGYPLTNQANAREGNTQAAQTQSDVILPVTLTRPVLDIVKGVVATDGVSTTFNPPLAGQTAFNAPGTAGPRFAGTISSATLAANPINSNLSGIDAGDRVTFAVVVENTGTGPRGAFDVLINDTIPNGFVLAGGGNLRVVDGTGALVPFTTVGGGLFGTGVGDGIQLTDPGATPAQLDRTDAGAIDSVNTSTAGRNIIVITYDLIAEAPPALNAVSSNVLYTNTARVVRYSAEEGGTDYAPSNPPTSLLTDPATVTIENPTIAKTRLSTSFNDATNTNAQAVIGEEITYRVVVTYPEGITPGASIVDLLDNGLVFVAVDSVTPGSGLSLTNAIGTGATPANVTVSGQTITFNTGTVTNTNTDNAAQTLTIVYRVRVANVAASQQGQNKNNRADVTFTGQPTTTIRSSAPDTRILEPIVSTIKDVTVGGVLNGTGDAGDSVSYTITLFNPAQTTGTGGNFTTVAYDVTLSDPLPTTDVTFSPTITYDPSGPARYNAGFFVIDGSGVLRTVSALPDLMPGETITLTVTGVINTTVTTGQPVLNTATTRFTSLPAGNPNEAFERTGSGGVNDYQTQDPGNFIISTPNPNKTIVLTSEASTAITSATQADVAIGEVVRYHVAVRIPQTTGLVNFRISDVLPTGLLFLNDDTASVALVSSGGTGLTSTLIPAGAQFNGTTPNVTPTFTFPSAQISNGTNPGNPFVDGDDPLFSFGTVTNTNSSTTTDEYVVLEFNALVLNSASNVAGVNLDNTFTLMINGVPDQTSTPAARVTIVEPNVEVAKVALNLTTGTTTGDAGDEVEYTITLTNSGGASAFNTIFGDTLPPELGLPTVFSVSGSGLATTDFTISLGGVISTNDSAGFTIQAAPFPNQVVIVVRGILTQAVTPTQSILNTADVTYTSLPGTNGTTGNTTGSDTPGLPGDLTGERTGDNTGPNDYLDSDTATIDVPNGSVVKSLDSTSLTDTNGANVAIGETITYALTVTLPEGTTSSLNLTDVLPAGVTFVAGSVAVNTTGFVGSGVSASPTVAVGAGNTLTIDFAGPIVVTEDNNAGNNSFVVTYTVQVVDVPGNVGILPAVQTTLVNAVTMTAGTSPPVTAPPITATVVEPELQIDKTVVTADTSIDAGTSIDYQLIISHVPNASTGPAYNLVITDALLPIGMTLNTASIVVTPSDATTVVGATTFDSNGVSITVDKLLPGETITVTYSATLNGPPAPGTVPVPGSTVINTATTTFNTYPTPGGRPEGPISDTAQITVNKYSISGEIYYDVNNNGTRQAGTEPLILQSIDLRLIGTDIQGNAVDVPLNTTTGQYTFDELRPGTYRVVQVATPTGYLDGIDTPGTPFSGTGDSPSSAGKTDTTLGAVGGTITSIVIPVNTDQDGVANAGINYNFGELLSASVGAFVWLDANNNGVQDGGGEVGIGNVPVILTGTDDLGAVSLTDTTDSLGAYSFTNLRPGTYVVTFGDSDGTTTYIRTVQNAAAATPATDSDADPFTGATAAITLAPGDNNQDIDEGLFLQADLQITKNDGVTTYTAGASTTYTIVVTNAGPSVVTGATVTDTFDFTRFTAVNWTAVAGTGAAAGATGFSASGTGNILDTVNMPVGSTITYTVIGTINSAATGILSNTATVTAPFGTIDPTPENNTATDDDDPNPIVDLSITKTDGITTYRRNQPLTYTIVVTNSGPSDVQDATVTDNFPAAFFPAGITWSVSGLTGGATSSFGVGVDQTGNILDTVDMPAGSTITYTATGVVAINATGQLINTATVSIPPGDPTPLNNTATDRDVAPNSPPPPPPQIGSIAGFVYQDVNNDGIKQSGEPGIGGTKVTLVNAITGVTVGTTTTASDGSYSFTDLVPGTYRLNETQPAGFTDGKDTVGSVGGVLVPTDSIGSIPVVAGTNGTGYNFGEIGSGVGISGTVFFDANKDGDLEAGEVGIPVVTITLRNSAGAVVGTTTTDANGNYSFPSVPPGTYTITETQPTGYGDPPSGPFAPNTRTVTVVSTPVTDQNFGDTLGGLSGLVYQDLNDDGIRQPAEPPIPGVTVTLFNGNTVVGTTTTSADGTYNFNQLPAGTYRVVETQPAGFTDGKDTVGSVGGTLVSPDTISSISLPAGVLGTGYNFGELFQGISGKVFLDVNKDGDLQAGEVGIPDVTITLRNSAGAVVGTTTTDANGNYSFPNVPPGTYTITESQPAAYGNPSSGPFAPNVRTVTLAAGTSSINQNFGDTPGGLSGLVYQDLNDDGIRQPAEPPIPGVTVTLFNGNTVVGTTTTSADGTYNFNQLPAGTYRVVETQPAGFTDGKDTVGSVGGQLVPTDTITNITLPAGVLATGYNFGELTTTNRLSGTVYLDVNQDSIYQPGADSPLQGITVTLRDTSGAVVAVTTTAADGTYSFSDLPAGRYTITETQPTGHGSSQIPFNVRTVTMPATGNVTNQNFGDTLGNISGRVYRDYNLDGVFTPYGANPDTGIPGITVTLRNAAGVVVATTVTDANGMYRFNNILPGRYTVTETQPPLPTTLTNGFYDGADNLGTLSGTRPVKNALSFVLGINPTTQISQNARSYNFGELPPADPNGFVYVDANQNGIRDPGEQGIAGVAITISGTAFFGTPFARPIVGGDVPGGSLTVFTNANGFYEFNPIPPGLYAIRERQPAGFRDGLEQNGDPSAPAPIVGNDVFSNILLNPFPIRGPFNFGELLPIAGGLDPTKRALLGSAM